MRKMGCLPVALLALAALWGGGYLYTHLWPTTEVSVPLPMGEATVRVQSWAGFVSSNPYVLIVDTPRGSLSESLWEDWGPAGSMNLYRTPEEWLVIIGAGGQDRFVNVVDPAGPRLVSRQDLPRTNDKDWVYLGILIVGVGLGSPSEWPECLELLGAGESPYRKKYQVEHSCTWPLK